MPELTSTHNVLLAIDTTGQTGSIAVFRGKSCLRDVQLDGADRTAASLAPKLDEILRWCDDGGCPPTVIAVAQGPGSFTGLRIGVTTAKTLCYASEMKLIAVDSLAAIAAAVMHEHPAIDTVQVGLNAYRGQVFAACFVRDELIGQTTDEVFDQQGWRDRVNEACGDEGVFFAGDEKVFQSVLPAAVFESRFHGRGVPDAVGVGIVGVEKAARGEFCDPMSLLPRYLKKSAAEEKVDQNQASG